MKIEPRKKWLGVAGIAASLYAIANLFTPTVVVGDSMAPTLRSGKVIWVDRTYYKTHKPSAGEVVVFRVDGITYVKRIYRGPGDVIHYVASGAEWVGPVRETQVSYVKTRYEGRRGALSLKYVRVPQDSIFVIGDNYLRSIDSRELGPIPMSAVIGRARLTIDTTKTLPFEFGPVRSRHAAAKAKVRQAAPQAARVASVAGI